MLCKRVAVGFADLPDDILICILTILEIVMMGSLILGNDTVRVIRPDSFRHCAHL